MVGPEGEIKAWKWRVNDEEKRINNTHASSRLSKKLLNIKTKTLTDHNDW